MSNSDKRTVATDALETLGTIIDETAQRDAIHLAVDPAIAVEMLLPGQDVGFVPGGVGACDNPVGIVDPFLKGPVHPGQRFWLVVYPRQITSLRHVWSHPSFEEESEQDQQKIRAATARLTGSDQYVRELAERVGVSYEQLMSGARDYLTYGDYLVGGSEMEGESVPDEFWDHYEILTGQQVEKRDSFFSCSC